MLFRTLTTIVLLLCSAWGAVAQNSAPQDYIIGPQDVLVITSYDQPELSGEYQVETDGSFGFPLVGRITVGEMTLQQAEAMLRKRLTDGGFFKQPQITVAVKEYKARKIFVLGEVRTPGVHALSGQMRIVEALALADSTLPTAGPEVVVIPSNTQGGSKPGTTIRVNLRALEAGDVSQNVLLQDGDTILVPRAEEVYVFGQVKNPGAYSVRDYDMTVLQALSLAGGVTDRGSMGRIEIVRIVDGAREEVKAELADVVQPGDTIVVPERYF